MRFMNFVLPSPQKLNSKAFLLADIFYFEERGRLAAQSHRRKRKGKLLVARIIF